MFFVLEKTDSTIAKALGDWEVATPSREKEEDRGPKVYTPI